MTTPRTAPVRVIGTFISPYVRKVLVCLDLKGIAWEIDPIVPFTGDARFSELSPVRRIPVLIDDEVTLADSTVICEYLDERHPSPPLFPSDPADRARARWLEEYADTRMGEVFIWRLFNQRVINPFVWGQATDEAVVRSALADEIPDVLGYLERSVPGADFLFGRPAVADVAIATFFRNAAFAGFTLDPARWPRTAAYVEHVLALDAFGRLAAIEDRLMRTPMSRHRAVLAELGVALTADTCGTVAPTRGVMRI